MEAKTVVSIAAANVDVREVNAPHLSMSLILGRRQGLIRSTILSMTVDTATDPRHGIDRRGLFCENTLSFNPDNVRQLGAISVAKFRILGTSKELSKSDDTFANI